MSPLAFGCSRHSPDPPPADSEAFALDGTQVIGGTDATGDGEPDIRHVFPITHPRVIGSRPMQLTRVAT